MTITKYEHACLDINDESTRIIIDPGKFSTSLTDFLAIDAVVITHIHSDHFDPTTLDKAITANPALKIYTNKQVAKEINSDTVTTVKAGDIVNVGTFSLSFWGGQHEFYSDFENIAVMIDDILYHPGDSYTVPKKSFKVLAAPASAPWLRAKDAADFILACKPNIAFPIHNSLLSEIGEEIHYRILGSSCKENSIDWKVLKPGESIQV